MTLTTTSTRAQIEALHALLCTLVPEAKCQLNMYREHEWSLWLSWRPDQPFTEADLRAVVAYRRRLLAQGSQFPACLKFGHLIGQLDRFEEDLAMARARPVAKPISDRDAVLIASGRPPKPAEKKHQLAGPLALQALNRLREAAE